MLRRPSVPGGSNGSIIRGFETPLRWKYCTPNTTRIVLKMNALGVFGDLRFAKTRKSRDFARIYALKRFLSIFSDSDLRLQGRSGHTESGGSSRRSGHSSFAFPEGRLNDLFLLRCKLLRQLEWTRRLR